MDTKELDEWKKIFCTRTQCDFCNESDAPIHRVTVHPVGMMKGKKMMYSGVIMAKECRTCFARKIDEIYDDV
jgi:hypothetical protein